MKTVTTFSSVAGVFGCGGAAAISYQAPMAKSVGLTYSTQKELQEFTGGICVDRFLSQDERKLMLRPDEVGKEWKLQKPKFKNPNGESRGCLAVSLDRAVWKNGSWKGIIRYEWVFTKAGETIITNGFYNTDKPNDKNWRLIYIDANKGKAEKAWLLWKGGMPTKPRPLFADLEHWPFDLDYKKVCAKGKCTGEPEKQEQLSDRWQWSNAWTYGNQAFSHWSDNFFATDKNPSLVRFRELVGEKGTWWSF